MTINRFQRFCASVVAGMMIVGAVGALPARADPPPGKGAKNWQNLPPGARKEYWKNLSKEEKQRLRQRRQQFQSSSPSEQERLCKRFEDERGYRPPLCRRNRK